jgi:hypothetical protein
LISVTPHNSGFNLNQTGKPLEDIVPDYDFPTYMECLVSKGEIYKCAV